MSVNERSRRGGRGEGVEMECTVQRLDIEGLTAVAESADPVWCMRLVDEEK